MENPTIETEGKPAETAATPKPAVPAGPHAELVAELEKFGVKNAEQLQGRMVASQEAGRLANQLGDARKEISEMRAMMERMNQQRVQPQQHPHRDEWGGEQPPEKAAGTIDLSDLVGKAVEGAISKRERAVQMAQQRAFEAWNKIQGDPDFHIVKDKWEAKLKDPNFALKFQAGAVDPYSEYQELLRDTYKSAVSRSAEIIKSLTTGAGPPQVHLEGQGKVSGVQGNAIPDKDKTLNPLREKVNKGKLLSEDEELAALMKVLGGGG
jgi:hypothetical protein